MHFQSNSLEVLQLIVVIGSTHLASACFLSAAKSGTQRPRTDFVSTIILSQLKNTLLQNSAAVPLKPTGLTVDDIVAHLQLRLYWQLLHQVAIAQQRDLHQCC